jgi:hypothetical protein
MRKMLLLMLVLLCIPGMAMGALISTDSAYYPPEDSVYITGSGYQPNETVTLQVTRYDGTLLPGDAGLPWNIAADESGNLQSLWVTPYTDYTVDTMMLVGIGDVSGEEGDALFVLTPTKNIDHLQNGTISAPPNWSNGNINSSNSCYGEARAIPYRYFISGLTGGTQHYFSISCEWTKATIHGFDYFTDYDLTEPGPIAAAGGSCGNISTPSPTDCQPISGSYAFPDPTNTANYTGTIPPDFFPAGFVLDGPRNLSFYNVVVDSVSKYWFEGTSSDREYLVTIYFTVQNTGSVGFYWGGHQAQGTADTWGVGNGTASIAGAPIHMRAGDFDGDGGFVDMAVQTGDACFPPDVTISCNADSVCTDSTYTCSVAAGAMDYTWSIVGGTIISGQGTETITYTVTADYPGTVEISIDACNYTDGCATDLCCASETVYLPVGNCCDPPEAICPGDQTIFVCDLSQICLPGFSCNGTPTVIGGTLNGSEVCFTPVEGNNTIMFICTNECDEADTCITNVNVVLNSAPVCNLPSDNTYFICSDSTFSFPVSATDTDGNLTGCTMTSGMGAFDGSNWTFTATASGVYSATFVCTDECGATCSGTVNITVEYNEPPVITCPADITVDCNDPTDPSFTGYATATDDHDPDPSITYSDSQTGDVITRTWTVTDECGESDQCVQTITIEDTTPPTLVSCPSTVTVQCTNDIPPADISLVGAVDDCDPNPIIVHVSDVSDGNSCPETITRTYRITDASGNFVECIHTIIVDDTEDPVITCPADITLDCNDPTDPSFTGYATATDNCDTDIDITYADSPNGGGFYRTWTATDDCGNSSDCIQTITIDDTTPPTISCPNDATVQCPGDVPPVDIGSVTVSDDCDPDPVVTHVSDVSDGNTCPEVITRTYRATDASGNYAECQQIITIDDTEDPIITCPADITVDCSDPTDPSFTGSATATDNCDTDIDITYSDAINGDVITRTWTAVDDCDNSASCDQIITIEDNTPPTITCPDDATVQCPGDVPPVDIGSVTVSDDCDPDPVVTHVSDVSDGNTCPEIITRTYSATDASGNYAECQQIITIDDTEDPIITCPADITVDCNDPTDPSFTGSATATDNCDTDIDITYSDTPNGNVITRTWTAVDDCDNSASCDQIITIEDSTPPTITCPNDATVQCPGDVPPVDIGSVTVSDDCDPDPVVTHVSDVSDGNTCPEVITRTYRATDASGNYAECQQIITIDDTEPPVITCPADITIDCDDPTDPSFTGSATASDNCDQDIEITYSDAINGDVITRTWTAVDDCDNPASCDQIITIEDNTPPTITCPLDATVQCPGDVPPVDINLVTVSDNCDPNPVVTHVSDVSDGNSCPEIITRTYGATDESGNYAECQQIITIDDTEDPTLNCPADITIDCTESTAPAHTGSASATDNCDQDVEITYNDVTNDNIITRTWTAVDDCNNSATCIQVITIEPNSPPVCNVPGDTAIISCDDMMICLPVSATDPDDNLVGCEITSGPGTLENGEWCYATSGSETINVTITCTDECGEFCETSFQVDFIINNLVVTIGDDTACVFNGMYYQTPVTLENNGTPLGGFELLITYDPSAFTFIEALRGDAISDWEYFTYRTGPFSNCGSGCPSGMILIVALADVNNGLPHPPESAFEPDGILAWLKFYVTEDREFGGQSFPLGFFWMDCTNNMFSSRSGDTVYVDKLIYGPFGDLLWDEGDDVNFPESERIFGLGAEDECLIGDKTAPIRCIIFNEGYISICHPDSIDIRGDLNLNNIANEIGDGVLYTNYFIYGTGVFVVNLHGQIAASDVNADGKTLTVGDLVYLIRVLNGDAAPFPKLAPFANDAVVNAAVNDNTIDISSSSDVDLGAIRLSFTAENAVTKPAVELAQDLTGYKVLYDIVGDRLNVLVYSFENASIPAGRNDIITITGAGEYELISAEASDYNGSEVVVSVNKTEIPREFGLSQNYPNPFNPETEILLSLPESDNWTLEIYNIKGQLVRQFAGYSDAGTVSVIWDSKDDYGNKVASGIYFYRGTAGDKYSLTRKMVLIK